MRRNDFVVSANEFYTQVFGFTMSCRAPKLYAVLLCILALSGCHPTQPVYMNDTGERSYYLDQATEIEYPDVEAALLDEVANSQAPITVTDADFDSFWDLSLQDVVAIALQNSKVIRGYGTPALQGIRVSPGVDGLANGPAGAGTLYNVAVRETEPGIIGIPGQVPQLGTISTNTGLDANQGVEAALAEFDSQLTSNLNWLRNDQPRNVTGIGANFTPNVFQQDQVTWQTELAKKTAVGTTLFARNVNSYTRNNIPSSVQPLESVFQTALEMEIRQPLLRGRGAFINRMPVVISRINSDQEIANLEAQIQNMVTNIEIRYWDLYCAYRILQTAKAGRDAALDTWRVVNERFEAGTDPIQDEAQARGQYNFFRAQVEQALADLLAAETNLRWLMGVASTDGRLIRPVDEPTKAHITFDWCTILDESLAYRPELRQERWELKKRELALAYAYNSLMPNLNATGLYRWLGLGDDLANHDDTVPLFPQDNSGSINELFDGSYQEFQLGLEFGMPVGFRRELSNVRNAQLKLAREFARLEDMELDVSRELTQTIQALDANYQIAQTQFNSWVAYSAELEGRELRYEKGQDPITFLLDAQRSRAQGEAAYYQAICEYNKVIALLHRRKGTILAYSDICLTEGAWPDKAYYDADEHSRRRSSSRQVNYGFTRPEVISNGPIYPPMNGPADTFIEGDYYYDDQYQQLEEISPEPTPANPQLNDALPVPGDGDASQPPQIQGTGFRGASATIPQPKVAPRTAAVAPVTRNSRPVDWDRFGLSRPDASGTSTEAVIKQVNYEEVIDNK